MLTKKPFYLAVVITNSMLFIVFGLENETKFADKLLMLDVTNPSKITLMDKFIDPSIDSQKRLTTGATIGIGVGVSAVVNITSHCLILSMLNNFLFFVYTRV